MTGQYYEGLDSENVEKKRVWVKKGLLRQSFLYEAKQGQNSLEKGQSGIGALYFPWDSPIVEDNRDRKGMGRVQGMKSRVLSVKDYHSIPVERKPFEPDEEELQRELCRLANPYIRWADGDVAAEGDMVACRLDSDCPRFRKENIKLVIGSGMLHRELEESVAGMHLGESRTAAIPEGRVEITVLSIKNRVVPGIEDRMAACLGLEGVQTVADYEKYLRSRQRQAYVEEVVQEFSYTLGRAVIDGSEFILRKEDWDTVTDLELGRCRAIAAQEGMVLEEMTPEQFEGRIPVKTYDGLVALAQDEAWDMLRSCLLGCHYAEADGFAVDCETYADFLREYGEQQKVSEEEARRAYPYERYCLDEYRGHFYEVLEQYIRESCVKPGEGA